ncbi:hypothetical protein IHE45_02G027100 [Dioscorea alata]|uniref:Uncharacterized protein n=2 Tax=Dioscorea alata TaxID=55571 RepID=A0ACB7WPH7_DIOAL|nr:hypothetical protein IHE45_02G027100 [Dioscorea alata]KAH7690163.1 hypothetical protein IHE45_02G027100 [Dioscorea alata]
MVRSENFILPLSRSLSSPSSTPKATATATAMAKATAVIGGLCSPFWLFYIRRQWCSWVRERSS